MNGQEFTTAITVDQTPQEAFAAINNVRGWWLGEIDGDADQLGSEFTYRYEDVHRSTQKVTEFVPGKTVVWRVVEAHLSFADNKTEWEGTEIRFDISKAGNRTEVRFTHLGLVPEYECFDSCSNAWTFLVNDSLRSLISTGVGATRPLTTSQ
ncbi:SRPBCC family protein [Jatrophihabitans sp. DSM 45814]